MKDSGKSYTNGNVKDEHVGHKGQHATGQNAVWADYVPFVDFIMHILSCDVFLSLPHVQRLCYGIASHPTSIIHSTWLKEKVKWIVHMFLAEHSNISLRRPIVTNLARIRGFNFNVYTS